jgi:hypothetical protein
MSELRHMSPRAAEAGVVHGAPRDSESACKLRRFQRRGANLANVFLGEEGHAVPGPDSDWRPWAGVVSASLSFAVFGVVAVCPEEQMSRVDARRVVAPMADAETRGNVTAEHCVCGSVCLDYAATAEREDAVAFACQSCGGPRPALIRVAGQVNVPSPQGEHARLGDERFSVSATLGTGFHRDPLSRLGLGGERRFQRRSLPSILAWSGA